jgi:hypothetical protein
MRERFGSRLRVFLAGEGREKLAVAGARLYSFHEECYEAHALGK